MNIYVLLILTTVFCILNYIIGGNDAMNPAFIFSSINFIYLFACCLMHGYYTIDISTNTVLILLSGIGIFTLFNLGFRNKILKRQKNIKMNIQYIRVSNIFMFFLFIIMFVVGYSISNYIMKVASSYGGGGNLISAIGIYDNVAKFAGENISVPRIYSIGSQFVKASAYVIAAIAINNYCCRNTWDKRFLSYLIVYLFYSLTSGGRSEIIRFVMAFIVDYIVIMRRINGSFSKGNFKLLLRLFCIAGGIIVLSFPMLKLMGKGDYLKDTSYGLLLSRYIGAPVLNLSHAIENGMIHSKLLGEQTFHGVYSLLGRILRNKDYIYNLKIPTSKIRGINFGNVYTMYYMFMMDFGNWGLLLVAPICMFYFASYTKLINNSNTKSVLSVNFFVYSYMFNALTMLLFSNRFYENMFSWNFLKLFFSFYIIWFYIKNIKICFGYKMKKYVSATYTDSLKEQMIR